MHDLFDFECDFNISNSDDKRSFGFAIMIMVIAILIGVGLARNDSLMKSESFKLEERKVIALEKLADIE